MGNDSQDEFSDQWNDGVMQTVESSYVSDRKSSTEPWCFLFKVGVSVPREDYFLLILEIL